MKVQELDATAFKGVRHVNIKPGGLVVAITGRNGQGKTSVLDAVMWAIGGTKFAPETPVRKGNAKAEVSVDLGELRITRTQTAKGSMSLTVTTRDGAPQKTPQALLDTLFASVAFDPLAFVRAKPAEQRETLIDAAGIRETIAKIEAEAAAAREERTIIGRQVKTLDAQLAGLPNTDGPTEETSVADLSKKIAEAHAQKASNERARKWLGEKKVAVDARALERDKKKRELAEITDRYQRDIETINAEISAICNELLAHKPTIEALVDPDVSAIETELRNIEGTNRQIRDRAQRQRLAAEHRKAAESYAALERRIEEAAIRKADALTKSPLPIPGIGLTEDGVTLNGVPIAQANLAEQIKASVALAAAVSPKLKVALVREASALDVDNQKALEEAATEAGLQVWLERVTNGEHVGITIVDGEVEGAEGGAQ